MIHLITYADKNFNIAAKLLLSEARALNLFDRMHCYTPQEIKDFLSDKWISKYPRGGGYWIWKPYIVWLELGRMKEGDILLYVDAGCQFVNSRRWNKYIKLVQQHDAVFMHFDSKVDYGWDPSIRHWTKQSAISYFYSLYNTNQWIDTNLLIGGCFFIKKTSSTIGFINEWLNINCKHQELLIDITNEEKQKQDSCFIEHRHDQSILSLLIYNSINKYHFKIIPEEIEWHYNSDDNKRAIIAARRNNKWVQANKKLFLRKLVKNRLISIKNRACR